MLYLILVFSFINGGFSEVFSAMQVASYLILVGIVFIFLDPKKRKYLMRAAIAGLLGAVFAFLTVLSAPGNQIRQGLLPEHPEIVSTNFFFNPKCSLHYCKIYYPNTRLGFFNNFGFICVRLVPGFENRHKDFKARTFRVVEAGMVSGIGDIARDNLNLSNFSLRTSGLYAGCLS